MTAPIVITDIPRTHKQNTRHVTPGIILTVNRPVTVTRKLPCFHPTLMQVTPTFTAIHNSNLIPSFSHHNLVSNEVVNPLSQCVWDTPGEEWTPSDFLDHSRTECVTPNNFWEKAFSASWQIFVAKY